MHTEGDPSKSGLDASAYLFASILSYSFGAEYKINQSVSIDFLHFARLTDLRTWLLSVNLRFGVSEEEEVQAAEMENKKNLDHGIRLYNNDAYEMAVGILKRVKGDSEYYNRAQEYISIAEKKIGEAEIQTLEEVGKPLITVTPAGGKYNELLTIEVDVENMAQGKIYYTTDGTEPDTNSTDFEYRGKTKKLKIESSKRFKFLAVSKNGVQSEIVEAIYDITE